MRPAFLSFYVGADKEALPRAPARVGQGLLVGLFVAAGFLAVFALVGVPIASSEIVVGDNRLQICLIDTKDAPIRSPKTTLQVAA